MRENEVHGDIEYGMQGEAQEDEMIVTQGAQDEILRIQKEDQGVVMGKPQESKSRTCGVERV